MKRKSLACVQCSRRKVKCDKQVPCGNCVRRHVAQLCRRPFDADEVCEKVQQLRSETVAGKSGHGRRKEVPSAPKEDLRSTTPSNNGRPSTLFNNASIENYMSSMRSLTLGYSHMNGLLSPEDSVPGGLREPIELSSLRLDQLMAKMDYQTSYTVCSFSCKYATLLHYGVVDRLFMEDHAAFWLAENGSPEECSLQELLKKRLADVSRDPATREIRRRDMAFWLALYYAILCVGTQLGVEFLQNKHPYSAEEFAELPRVLMRASLEWLQRARFLENPDIRTIQVYCVMTTCLHALGNVYIHRQLLGFVVGIAKVLGMDRMTAKDQGSVNFQREVAKRLWYSFFLVDSISNIPKRMIGDFSTTFPKLISTDELLGTTGKCYAGGQVALPSAQDDLSGLLYQRLMVQMSQIKQDSYRQRENVEHVTKAWCDMLALKEELDGLFGSAAYDVADTSTRLYAKYLLFSSLSRECVSLGARLLTLMGRPFWLDQFRPLCLKLALELVQHNSMGHIPVYYQRYWIVGQHLIYGCLFVLLDMLMFNTGDCQHNMQLVKNAIPTVQSLSPTHYTVRVGVAVIEKLYHLVESVRLKHRGRGTVEDFSLREFLHELEVANPGYRAATSDSAADSELLPPFGESQYLRHSMGRNVRTAARPLPATSAPIEAQKSASFLDPEIDSALDDTGWKEFLGFFFGQAEEETADIVL